MDLSIWRDMLAIDINQLHLDIAQQPLIFEEVGQACSLAKADAKKAKLKYELLCSDLSTQMRKEPAKFGIDKITEKGLEMALLQCTEVRTALNTIQEFEQLADQLSILLSAFDQRRTMLSQEVQLYSANYWGVKSDMDTMNKVTEIRRARDG